MGPGIYDPLRQIPTMHALLDIVEAMILEGMSKPEDRDAYYRRVYTPPLGTMGKRKTPPPGWSAEDEMAGFRAAL